MISCARKTMSTVCSKASTSNVPSGRRNFMRFSEARLHAESSTCMYSEHGFEALMRPEFGHVCHWLIVVSYWTPGSAQRHAASAMSRISWRAGVGAPLGSPPPAGDRAPLLVALGGVHERVGRPHRVVRVLVLDRLEAVAVDRHVESRAREGLGLLLLPRLAPDELADVGRVDVEHDHLRRAARLAARLDRARPRIGAAHERHRPPRRAALRQRLHRPADVGEVDPRAGAAAEDAALLGVPLEDRLERVLDRQDEAGRALWVLLEAHVEPHG